MLDDQNWIKNLDPDNALGQAEAAYQQLEHRFSRHQLAEPRNVVMAGMGGSALAGHYIQSWLGETLPVPFAIWRNYGLPGYVDERTLVIASSYSGNTEEALDAYYAARQRGAPVAVLAGGGQLADIARQEGLPFYQLPQVSQPRFAVFASLLGVVTILADANLTSQATKQLASAAGFLRQTAQQFAKTTELASNQAKKLALELAGTAPVIYGGPLLKAAAYKWKISFNESAKNIAWWNEWPEFNHNEFIGWSSHPIQKPYKIIELISKFEPPRIEQRYRISNRLLSGHVPEPMMVAAKGKSPLQELLWATMLGDFCSLYLALLNGQNPTPVALVEKLKTELAKQPPDSGGPE